MALEGVVGDRSGASQAPGKNRMRALLRASLALALVSGSLPAHADSVSEAPAPANDLFSDA